MEKDLSEKENTEFNYFKFEFEEYINSGEVSDADIFKFSTDEKIEVFRLANETGSFHFVINEMSYETLPYIINRDFSFVLNYLIRRASFGFVCHLEKILPEMNLKISQLKNVEFPEYEPQRKYEINLEYGR
ncbi:hypothetical protein DSAG12_03826 [Promethearchaeum syntrophicum]|uniref:Uncharacterized protein n=1 Tax=Promethearchaeum syntrophicum TaxID=2594042 RepID=A0A5B9DFC4_9ARCH|nr:hypothetical protein [Candidatus Prometheoarchaeum syntrophicum]QEE17988.1 hypothetical protein DSAG12_03826 [Candidatus Prometheoarchaeum syntrophicum]